MTVELRLAEERETLRLAESLGRNVRSGAMICLRGPLGSGKTTFARAFARGAGFRGEATSPTFAIVNEYRLRGARGLGKPRTIYHLDLYRVEEEDLANLGLEEYFSDSRAASMVEWPQAAKALLPADRLEVSLSYAGAKVPQERRIRLKASGPRSRALLERMVPPISHSHSSSRHMIRM